MAGFSLPWCVISVTATDLHSLVVGHNFNRPIPAVVREISRTIGQRILTAQVILNLRKGVGNILRLKRSKCAPAGCIGNQGGALRADVGMPQIDVGNPCPHQDPAGCCAHQLGRRHRIIVDLSGKDRIEACILGLVNTDLDPNGQMNVWLSSGENHQWNPSQKSPATAWEAEIDKMMREQATAPTEKERKAKFDGVQQIAVEQQPFIYLINKDVLLAVSPNVVGAAPVVLEPWGLWNVDTLRLGPAPELGAQK